MPERCDPYIYFHRVRPYIHGWKDNPALGAGLIYGLKILFVTAVGGYLSPSRAALGAAAFGLAVGSAASWFLARFILEMPWSFSGVTAKLRRMVRVVAIGGLCAAAFSRARAASARPDRKSVV